MTIQVEILHFLHYNPSSGRDFILDCPDYLKELSEDTIIRWQRIGCIVVKISETLNVSLTEALDMFYKSETCRRFLDEETGLPMIFIVVFQPDKTGRCNQLCRSRSCCCSRLSCLQSRSCIL